MNKKIKELLNNNQQITIRWKNFNSWETSFKGNFFELALKENMKFILKKDGIIKIIYVFGSCSITISTNLGGLERDIIRLVSMSSQYLGDKCKIISPYKPATINF